MKIKNIHQNHVLALNVFAILLFFILNFIKYAIEYEYQFYLSIIDVLILLFCLLYCIIKKNYINLFFIVLSLSTIVFCSKSGFLNYLRYQGFLAVNSPLENLKRTCIANNYNNGKAESILSFCLKRNSYILGYPTDIMYDSGGQISLNYRYRSDSWKVALRNIAVSAKKSELHQIAGVEDVDSIYFSVLEIGGGFYEVAYSVENSVLRGHYTKLTPP